MNLKQIVNSYVHSVHLLSALYKGYSEIKMLLIL